MPSWNELLDEFANAGNDSAKSSWIEQRTKSAFDKLSAHQHGRNVVLYGSAFLQKPASPAGTLSIAHEDINGFMSTIYGMDWSKGLTLVLHTPGGNPNAAQTIVEYLRSKFSDVDVIVPALAMSAGTMISLASDKIVMGRQSQLGPIDPQLTMGGRTMSARGIVEQFQRAAAEITANPVTAHVWAPITQSLGPALLQDAQNALDYSEQMVAQWLARWMFADQSDPAVKAGSVAEHFNDASAHKSHGRRIDYNEVKSLGVTVERLEDDQDLQEAVLTVYHLMTIIFEHSPSTKMIAGSNGRSWTKNLPVAPPGA